MTIVILNVNLSLQYQNYSQNVCFKKILDIRTNVELNFICSLNEWLGEYMVIKLMYESQCSARYGVPSNGHEHAHWVLVCEHC